MLQSLVSLEPIQKLSKPAPNQGLGFIAITTGQISVRPVSVGSFPIVETIPTAGFIIEKYKARKISDPATRCTIAGFRASAHRLVRTIRVLPRKKHAVDVTELAVHKHHIPIATRDPCAISRLVLPSRSPSRNIVRKRHTAASPRTMPINPNIFLFVVRP